MSFSGNTFTKCYGILCSSNIRNVKLIDLIIEENAS